jgi:phosphohistidine phosphatase SixA
VLRLLALLLLFASPAQAFSANEPGLTLEQTIVRLRQGGFVIYFRHGETGSQIPDRNPTLADCSTQRNLNDQGRREAVAIGQAMAKAGVPIGPVKSSEFCRCWQTADLAFGRHEKTPGLTLPKSHPSVGTDDRKRAAAALQALLAEPPPAGTNTVLVSHGWNLLNAEGFHLDRQGEAAIYQPDGRGGMRLIARLLPEDW